MSYHPSRLFFYFLPFLFLTAGCNNKYVENVNRGQGYNYVPGHPELRTTAVGQIREDNTPIIIVSGDLVKGSFIYSNNDDAYSAQFSVQIVILKTSSNSDNTIPAKKREFEDQIEGNGSGITNSQDVYRFEETFTVEPGQYNIQVLVTDKVSGKTSSQVLSTTIPNPKDPVSHITEIQVLGKNTAKDTSEFNHATTYDIPSRVDSLKFAFQVTNNKPDDPIEITTRLIKFEADSTIARPMSYNNYTSSSIQYQGIDYSEYDIIQQSSRILEQPGSVIIELTFSDLSRGNYRLEVSGNVDEENELYKARDFSIKSKNYPSLATPKELARPLYYIMNQDEYEKLMDIEDPKELKSAIDRFWLTNIQNSSKAKNVISLYYQRVEEANKQFSNYKEGWKTDPGMIYILFGPPLYNDQFSDQMYWSYSYNQNDPEKNFLFIRPKLKNVYFPFHHYLLQRDSFYHSIFYQQTERWRTGTILNTNL